MILKLKVIIIKMRCNKYMSKKIGNLKKEVHFF